ANGTVSARLSNGQATRSQGYALVSIHRNVIHGYTPIGDVNPIDLPVLPQGRTVSRPVSWQGRVDIQHATATPDAEYRLDRRTVQPTTRSGVPGPAAAPQFVIGGIHISRHDIGFDAIGVGRRAGQRVIDRV